MTRPGRLAIVVFALCAMATCSSQNTPDVPHPGDRIPAAADVPSPNDIELTSDDIVIAGVAIDGFLRSPYGVPYNMRHGGVRMIMPDRTIRVCTLPSEKPFSYDCIQPRDQEALDRLITADHGPDGAQLFRDRNSHGSVIRRQIDSQLLLVPNADLLEMLEGAWMRPVAQRFPGKQGIVMISAPTHPTPERSAIYVLHVVNAAAYVDLSREEGIWKVRAVHGLWIA